MGDRKHLTLGAGKPRISPELQGRLQKLARIIIFFTLNNRTIKKKKKAPLKWKKKNPLRTSCNLLSLDGWGKAQASGVCTELGASLECLWESPACVPQLPTLTAAEHFQCAQRTEQTPSHSAFSPPHVIFTEITTTQRNCKRQLWLQSLHMFTWSIWY